MLLLIAMLVYDRTTRGRFHPATVWGSVFLVTSRILRIVASETGAWQVFREVARQLTEGREVVFSVSNP
jgi:hypothetical protein